MTTALILMITTSIILIILFVFGVVFDNYYLWGITVILLFLQIFIGYFLLGSFICCNKTEESIKAKVEKTSTTAFVTVSVDGVDKTFERHSHKDYMTLNDSTCSFTLVREYNMYNKPTNTYLKYTVKEHGK